jgi:tellurite resistance protein TehA-like permease
VLVGPALRRWYAPGPAAALMLPVATQALSALAGQLGAIEHLRWLIVAALVLFAAGLALYAFAITRLRPRELVTGRGEHWVAGGALAISSLAAGRIVLAAQHLGFLGGFVGALKVVLAAVWIASIAWLPVLVASEIRWPRLRYDERRWATVFPLGMYSACSFMTGAALGATAISEFARVWAWVALAAWAAIAIGALADMRARVSGASRVS